MSETLQIWLDTNTLWKLRRVRDLARLARASQGTVHVSALVHAERVAQVRREYGREFLQAQVDSFLRTHEISVEPLDKVGAEKVGQVLSTIAPDASKWSEMKGKSKGTATLDWYICAHAHTVEKVWFVTNDRGDEHGEMKAHGLDVLTLEEALSRLTPVQG